MIAGIDVASVQRLLADRSPLEQMFERLGEPQPRFYRYTLNVVVANAGVPAGMQRDVFYVRDVDKALSSENLMHVELSRLDADHSLLCAESLLPARTVEERDGSLDDARERVMAISSELVPFIDRASGADRLAARRQETPGARPRTRRHDHAARTARPADDADRPRVPGHDRAERVRDAGEDAATRLALV